MGSTINASAVDSWNKILKKIKNPLLKILSPNNIKCKTVLWVVSQWYFP